MSRKVLPQGRRGGGVMGGVTRTHMKGLALFFCVLWAILGHDVDVFFKYCYCIKKPPVN